MLKEAPSTLINEPQELGTLYLFVRGVYLRSFEAWLALQDPPLPKRPGTVLANLGACGMLG